jgi:DNA processing protein
LSTARHGLEQGKEVFAVPGNITSLLSVGANRLIRQGATPFLEFNDIIEVLAPEKLEQAKLVFGENEVQNKIIAAISAGLRDGEEIMSAAGLSAAEFFSEMTMMEINGVVRALGANCWVLK